MAVVLCRHVPGQIRVKIVANGSEHEVASWQRNLGVLVDRLENAFDDLSLLGDILLRFVVNIRLIEYRIQSLLKKLGQRLQINRSSTSKRKSLYDCTPLYLI